MTEQIGQMAERIDRRLSVLEQLYPGTNRVFADRDGEWSLPLLRREIEAALSRTPSVGEDEVERVALAIIRAVSPDFNDEMWLLAIKSHRELEAQFGKTYSDGSGLVPDAIKRARAAIAALSSPSMRGGT
jgi:hypothetical protein